MTNKVKVKVNNHHFKSHFKIGETMVTDKEPVEVEVNTTVRNAVNSGTLELVEGNLGPRKDEKEFQEDDGDREESQEDDRKNYSQMTKDELKDLCEKQDVKKSGTKDELIERLKNN